MSDVRQQNPEPPFELGAVDALGSSNDELIFLAARERRGRAGALHTRNALEVDDDGQAARRGKVGEIARETVGDVDRGRRAPIRKPSRLIDPWHWAREALADRSRRR